MTRTQIAAAIEITQVIGALIRDMSPIPSGELYAQLMATGMNLADYNSVIDLLKRSGLIKVENHLITWIVKEN